MSISNLFYGHQDALMCPALPPVLSVGDFWLSLDKVRIPSSASSFFTFDTDCHPGKVRRLLFRSGCCRAFRTQRFLTNGTKRSSFLATAVAITNNAALIRCIGDELVNTSLGLNRSLSGRFAARVSIRAARSRASRALGLKRKGSKIVECLQRLALSEAICATDGWKSFYQSPGIKLGYWSGFHVSASLGEYVPKWAWHRFWGTIRSSVKATVKKYNWTNPSVLRFAEGHEPVEKIERAARELALRAMDEGWSGPPFDPLALADWCGLRLDARGDIPDARLVPAADGKSVLQYNPMRPRGRLRFSIAHEIAHTLLPDHAEQVRNRAVDDVSRADNWQLEVLCNVGAAELLMPMGSFSDLAGEQVSIQKIMDARKKYDVSVEACIIRFIKLATKPMAAFCASVHKEGQYRVDYVIPAAGWKCPVKVGQAIPAESVIKEATTIGFTAVGDEAWTPGAKLRVECVALAPYPGAADPRVVGVLLDPEPKASEFPVVQEVDGDAMQPRGRGKKLLAHVIPNTTVVWGGRGFASALRRKFPQTWEAFEMKTLGANRKPVLGDVFLAEVSEEVTVAHMVAQQGFGTSKSQRLRYAALSQCLQEVRVQAERLNATVHMPRVGTGHGGADWQVVKELIAEELVDKGVQTTVYRLPANAGA